jgi:hypothetical protein
MNAQQKQTTLSRAASEEQSTKAQPEQELPATLVQKLRLFPDLRWEKEVRWERTAMKERPTGVKFVG